MSGGSNSLKPGQPRSTNINTVQTLLKEKLGSTKEKAPKRVEHILSKHHPLTHYIGNYLSKNFLH
jgi:hypothetical protein